MSYCTYINGNIIVSPFGRTNEEKEYILKTVINHLPIVTGSDGNMNVYVIQKNGHNSSSSHDEFGQRTNNLIDYYGNRSRNCGMLRVQDEYILVVNAALIDREFDETFREFMKWIVRLGKRVSIEDVLVEVKGYDKSFIIRDREIQREKYSYRNVFGELFEDPSWCNDSGEPTWCEYLMWNRMKDSFYPMILGYKYFNDEENDEEVERRMQYEKGE